MLVGIIADDLTGLTAVASEFERYGFSVGIALSPEQVNSISDRYDIIGVDTNSREKNAQNAAKAAEQAAEEDGERHELRCGLPLTVGVDRNGAVRLAARRRRPLTNGGHGDLAADDDRRRDSHGDSAQPRGGLSAQEHERGGDHEFIRDRVEEGAEGGDELHLTREVTVGPVRDGRRDEDGAAGGGDPRAGLVEDPRDQGNGGDADEGQRGGKVDFRAAGGGDVGRSIRRCLHGGPGSATGDGHGAIAVEAGGAGEDAGGNPEGARRA